MKGGAAFGTHAGLAGAYRATLTINTTRKAVAAKTIALQEAKTAKQAAFDAEELAKGGLKSARQDVTDAAKTLFNSGAKVALPKEVQRAESLVTRALGAAEDAAKAKRPNAAELQAAATRAEQKLSALKASGQPLMEAKQAAEEALAARTKTGVDAAAKAAKVPLAETSLEDAKALLTSNGLKTVESRTISVGFATHAVLGTVGKFAFTGGGGALVSAAIAGYSDQRAVNNHTMTVEHARADVTVQAVGGGVSALAGAVAGAEAGALLGTLIPLPIVGTVFGASVGALAGLAGSTAVGGAFEHWAAKPMTKYLEDHVFGGKKASPSPGPAIPVHSSPIPVAPSVAPSKPTPPQATPTRKPTP